MKRNPYSRTYSLDGEFVLVRQVPATGRAFYYVAKRDGSFMGRSFTNKTNALKQHRIAQGAK